MNPVNNEMLLRVFDIGDPVEVLDRIDLETRVFGTVNYIEPDSEDDMYWIYIVADAEELNDKTDPRFNKPYFAILESFSPYLKKREG